MKIIFFFIFISPFYLNAQISGIYGEVHLESIIFKGDTLTFNPPKTIVFNNTGKTNIISVGKLKLIELAVQCELLKSKIGQSEYYMLGKCFYIKNQKDWKEISRFDHHKVDIEKEAFEIGNDFQGIYAAENDLNGFGVGSWYVFFKK